MVDKCEKASVNILGKIAVIRTERKGKAIVGLNSLCTIAKRLGLCIDGYKC
ncbi:MAG: hypothetical protein QXG46_03215 [Ignisphaera sp.]